ncbi:5078_t:CDS:1 [Ambispora gerdemannii]|uniref:5078_t:CDS:1 n=1 Tax=Ambispora gerdemannii TaxID=144530 RepID=A0A9N9C209_9GLOM|nr:5078_t:CDS:1 [Ambispora gerdemannii]
MKTVIVALIEEKTTDCDVFNIIHKFDSEWCLDLHGFLNRDEFAARLNEINHFIRQYPLLSERAKTLLKKVCGSLVVSLLISLLVLASISAGKSYKYFLTGVVINACFAFGYYLARMWIENIARRRAERFTNAVNALFAQYNQQENPTANWNLVWRTVVTHYTIKTQASLDGSIKGEVIPVYAEYAEIVLEINDALSDLTARTVRVNLALDNVSVPYNLPQSYGSHGSSITYSHSPYDKNMNAGTSV